MSNTACTYNTDINKMIADGCHCNYYKSDAKSIVDAWGKDNIKSEDTLQYNGIRLLDGQDFVNLGYNLSYDEAEEQVYTKTGLVPNWLYEGEYYYWTMSRSKVETSANIRAIDTNGNISYTGVYNIGGVIRPVVTIFKSALNQ